MSNKITIYTDGAATGNPGPGGYGVILISGSHRLEKSQGFKLTTNNRMELMAAIAGLEALKKEGSKVTVYTDSKYVADAIEKGWLFQWESKGFKKKKNPDLWIRFLKAYRKHNVNFVWIKGHANIPENENCDRLAVEASKMPDLNIDSGYVPETGNGNLFKYESTS
jgi:ribonuclease HI